MTPIIGSIVMSLFCLHASALAVSADQTSLKQFFETRLSASQTASAPTYEELLKVVDPIATTDAEAVKEAIPAIITALQRVDNNLNIEAVLALHSISRRKDGGQLLASRVVEIGKHLDDADSRVSGGIAIVMRNLTPSLRDGVIPMLTAHLAAATPPTAVKVELMSILLDVRNGDPTVIQSVEKFLAVPAKPAITISTLQVVAAHHFVTPALPFSPLMLQTLT